MVNETFFNEFTLRLAKLVTVVDTQASGSILAGLPLSRLNLGRQDLKNLLLVAATECVGDEDIERLTGALGDDR